jgi:hypothetical protein
MLKVVMVAGFLILSSLFGQIAMAHTCCYTIRNTVLGSTVIGCTIRTENLRGWQEYRGLGTSPTHRHQWEYGSYIVYTYKKISGCVPAIQEGN